MRALLSWAISKKKEQSQNLPSNIVVKNGDTSIKSTNANMISETDESKNNEKINSELNKMDHSGESSSDEESSNSLEYINSMGYDEQNPENRVSDENRVSEDSEDNSESSDVEEESSDIDEESSVHEISIPVFEWKNFTDENLEWPNFEDFINPQTVDADFRNLTKTYETDPFANHPDIISTSEGWKFNPYYPGHGSPRMDNETVNETVNENELTIDDVMKGLDDWGDFNFNESSPKKIKHEFEHEFNDQYFEDEIKEIEKLSNPDVSIVTIDEILKELNDQLKISKETIDKEEESENDSDWDSSSEEYIIEIPLKSTKSTETPNKTETEKILEKTEVKNIRKSPISENRKKYSEGHLEIYIGSMSSGKSTAITFKLAKMADNGFKCLYINHKCDTRTTEAQDSVVSTHNSQFKNLSAKIDGIKVDKLNDIDITGYDYIAIDEGQFYDDLYETVITWITSDGKYVMVSSLDGDAFRRKFGQVLDLIPHADKVEKLLAYCDICRDDFGILKPAPFTGRLDDNTDAKLVGGKDIYKAMCRECHDSYLLDRMID